MYRLLNPFILAIIFITLLFSSCSENKPVRTKPYVVSTTTLLKDLVDILWGDQVESISLMGPGVDPHLYQATAQDLKKLEEADMIVAHGLHLEGKMVEALEALSKKKNVFILGDKLDKTRLLKVEESYDPHIWFDPEIWIESAKTLSLNPPSGIKNQIGLDKFSQEVQGIKKKYADLFSKIPLEQKIIITSHDAFHYLGRSFNIEVQGIQGLSTDSEVGIKKIEELIDLIKKRKVKAIFSETSVSPRSIEKLMSESNVKIGGTLYSDALGPPESKASTYTGMLEHNLSTIYEALKQ